MLVQFTVENFLSFRDKTTFSMKATSDDQHSGHVVQDDTGNTPPLVRAAAIYGANAAGKSNLVKAVRFAQKLIVEGTRSGQAIPVTPFKLSANNQSSSRFEFIFSFRGVRYSYGFILNSHRIDEEWLYANPNRTEVLYFERNTLETGRVEVKPGRTLTQGSKKQGQFLEFVAKGTRPNQLFLTELMDHNVLEIAPVMEWFDHVLTTIPAEAQHSGLETTVQASRELTDFIGSFLRTSGTGVEGMVADQVPLDIDRDLPGIPDNYRQELSNLSEDQGYVIRIPNGPRLFVYRAKDGQLLRVVLKTQHRMEDGSLVTFEIDEESDGTQRLIHLAPALFGLQEEAEAVVLLDELDRRLHPLLSRLIVQAALEGKGNNSRSQLIFTTHETSLLDLDLLRRDEIWFVEKDQSGGSQLYSLAEFKIRPDLKVQKGYLNGRFGAIPFLGDIRGLGWATEEPQTLVEA